MKKTFTILFVLTLLSITGFSQEEDKRPSEYRNQITFSPFVFAFGEFQLNYERLLSDNFGLRLSGNYRYGSNNTRTIEGFKGEVLFKYYFSTYEDRSSVIRMHFTPYFLYRRLDITLESPEWSYELNQFRNLFQTSTAGGGILFGADFTFGNKFTMCIYFGGGIKKTNDDGAPDVYSANLFEPAYSGVYPKGGFEFGFAF